MLHTTSSKCACPPTPPALAVLVIALHPVMPTGGGGVGSKYDRSGDYIRMSCTRENRGHHREGRVHDKVCGAPSGGD